jgi:hypothetical protein
METVRFPKRRFEILLHGTKFQATSLTDSNVDGGDVPTKHRVLARATRCNIPDDGILHSHCRENLKSYIALTGWAQ